MTTLRCLTGAALAATAALAAGCTSSASTQPPSPAAVSSHGASASPTAMTGTSHATLSAEAIATQMHLHHVIAYTAASDLNHLLGRQHEYTSKVNWRHGGSTDGNSIEVFRDNADMMARARYLSGFTCPFGDGYDYAAGSALLRLGCAYTPAQAHQLRAAFDSAVSRP